MRRTFGWIILTALLLNAPVSAHAEVHMCFGKPATIVGTPGDDILQGTEGPDVIVGLAGSDFINGHGGNDLICGGRGDEGSYSPSRGVGELNGGPGRDKVSGGRGNDEINGGINAVPTEEPSAADLLVGNAGDDHICDNACYQNNWQTVDAADDRLIGGPGDDILSSTGGDDYQSGGPGIDELGARLFACDPQCGEEPTVDTGSDILRGGRGPDSIYAVDGISGNDRVDGGANVDSCTADRGDSVHDCEAGAVITPREVLPLIGSWTEPLVWAAS